MLKVQKPGIVENGDLTSISQEEFNQFVNRYKETDFYNAFLETVPIVKDEEQKFFRWDIETEPQEITYLNGEEGKDVPIRAFLGQFPLQFNGVNDEKVPYDGYFSVWLSRNFGLGMFTCFDFELNFGKLDKNSVYGLTATQPSLDLLARTGFLDMDEAYRILKTRGSDDWIKLKMAYHTDSDAYLHLKPNHNRIQMWEGDVDLTDKVLKNLYEKVSESRS